MQYGFDMAHAVCGFMLPVANQYTTITNAIDFTMQCYYNIINVRGVVISYNCSQSRAHQKRTVPCMRHGPRLLLCVNNHNAIGMPSGWYYTQPTTSCNIKWVSYFLKLHVVTSISTSAFNGVV